MARRKKSGNKKSHTGRLRIVAGKWRSRLLEIADVPGLRPTAERVRETLFNWLSMQLHGARCLDLCAGTGALGLEALSRGAASALFIENSRLASSVLQSNIRALDANGATVHFGSAIDFLSNTDASPFDLVFVDPPFAADMLDELCRLLAQDGWLASQARVYLEMDREQAVPVLPDGWHVQKDKQAGNVRYMLVAVDGGGS